MTPEALEARRKYQREYMRNWKKNHRERANEFQRNWAKNNPEKIKAIQERYWENKSLVAVSLEVGGES